MFSKLSAYLRRGRSAKEGQQFEDWNVELLATANVNLAWQLQRADQRIKVLQARLAESDLLLAHTQSRMGDVIYTALQLDENVVPASSKEAGRFKWVDDVWIYTGRGYLKDAEEAWSDGDIQSAQEILENALASSPFLSVAEGLHSRVLLAAVLYASGKYHGSLSQLDFVMNFASSRSEVQRFRYRDIVNTAYFLEAVNFMALERFERAYWSFSRSLQLPGYGEKARQYQMKAIEEFTRQQAVDDGASESLSLRPVISSDEYLPVSAGGDDNHGQYRIW
ncbi:hypothetical protein F1880_002824 [Penicillium rolfsii]|nr:hypothetical protein F1880_002824 [Penicillium rolfsii]